MAKKESKFCFIISHIGSRDSEERKDANAKSKHLFRPVLEELKYESKRSDDEATPGFISTQIIKRLIDSKLVIADISFENANVFYELAVRHAIKKPVIVIKKPKQRPPFDITDIRAIDVDMSDPDIWQPAMTNLRNYIKEAESDPEKASESILSNFTQSFNLQSRDDKESESLRIMKDIQSQFNRLSSDVENLKNKNSHVIDSNPILEVNPDLYKTFSIGAGISYTLKCKKCNRLFNTVSNPPSMFVDTKIQERCPHCHKKSSYGYNDFINNKAAF